METPRLTWQEVGAVVHHVYAEERTRGGTVTPARVEQCAATVLAVGNRGEHLKDEEVHQMSGKIQAVHVDDTGRPTERPAMVEGEVARELARPGNEGLAAIVNTHTGAIATVAVPRHYFDQADYERRSQKQRQR